MVALVLLLNRVGDHRSPLQLNAPGGCTKDTHGLVDHLFRHEAGKMVSSLTRVFGLGRLDFAEDVVQDALIRALETWPIHGVPENPSAWLMRVARNRAIDLVRRDKHFSYFTPELTELLYAQANQPDLPATEKEIQDDQLRMMFSCCNPALTTEAQVTLILKTLCGFSVSEIANALLSNPDSIEKRLGRARKLFRESGSFVELNDPSEIPRRLEAVFQAIYLLFNEGYHGSRSERIVREELCYEAIRLALLLAEHPESQIPRTHALLALLCFHAARLSSRIDDDGGLIQLEMQDRSKWDQNLVGRGFRFFEKASEGNELSEFHLEAAIAAVHCAAKSYDDTEWSKIVELYDLLYQIKPSPIVALNRAVAIGRAHGPEKGLIELGKIQDLEKLQTYPFVAAAHGEFHLRAGRPLEASKYFEKAMKLARNQTEINFFERKQKLALE